MMRFCPTAFDFIGKRGVIAAVAVLFFGLLPQLYGVQAVEIGTNVEFRTEFAGVASHIGAQSVVVVPVTGVVQADWILDNAGKAQSIVDELRGQFASVIVRVSPPKVGADSFRALTPDEARRVGSILDEVSGIHAVEFGNEINNLSREWTGGTIGSYITAYNAFAQAAPKLRVGPAALDTFFANDAVAVAGQIKANASRIDVLFFNAYEGRDKSQWRGNNGCSLSDWQVKRQTGCSWDSVWAAYGRPGVELILTEFSLKPPDNDTSLPDVLEYIQTVGPSMNVSLATPLIRNACGGDFPWLYLVSTGDGFGLVDRTGASVDPASCNIGTAPPSNPIGTFLTQLIQAILVRVDQNLVTQGCDPLGNILDGRDDETSRTFGVPCLNELTNNRVTHTNQCTNQISQSFTFVRGSTEPRPWVPKNISKNIFAGKQEPDENLTDLYPHLDKSTRSPNATKSLPLSDTRRLFNLYLGGGLANRDIGQKAASGPRYEAQTWAGAVQTLTPYKLPGSDVEFPTQVRNYFIDHTLSGLAWSLKTNPRYGSFGVAGALGGVSADPDTVHDVVACYITADGKRHNFADAAEFSLPVRLSYFACRNDNFPVEFLSHRQKEITCNVLYGPFFAATGQISEKSVYGSTILTPQQRAISPLVGEALLYQNGRIDKSKKSANIQSDTDLSCFNRIVIPNTEAAIKTVVSVDAAAWDPSRANQRERVTRTEYAVPIGRSHELVTRFAQTILPHEIQQRVHALVNQPRIDQICSNQPLAPTLASAGIADDIGDVLIRSEEETLEPDYNALFCPPGATCAGVVNGATDAINTDVHGVASPQAGQANDETLAQVRPITPTNGGATQPTPTPTPPPLVTVTDTRTVTTTHEYHFDDREQNEFAKAALAAFTPYPYIKKYSEKLPGTNLTLADTYCLGSQQLRSDLDDKVTDKPFPGCGKIIWLQDLYTQIARPYFPGGQIGGPSIPTGPGAALGPVRFGKKGVLDYSIGLRATQCSPSESIITAAADRMAGTGRFSSAGAFYAGGMGERGAQNLRSQWQSVVTDAQSRNVNPTFALALWIEESAAGGSPGSFGMGCIYRRHDGARMTPGGSIAATRQQVECLDSYINPVSAASPSFTGFMCRYSGEERDSATDECSAFTNNPNFPGNVAFWYEFLSQGQPTNCRLQR